MVNNSAECDGNEKALRDVVIKYPKVCNTDVYVCQLHYF